ncbi:MAG: hypothetical protein B7Y82_13910 [Sphingomonadales bacterium 32-65-25]|nr:MAG: hypothetical protein B7Y82_13910 [Sphingomonadales bacterium 32-65-25]
MTPERHPIKRDSMGTVPIGRALARAESAPASQPASPSGKNTPEWQRKLAEIGAMLSEEAIRARVNLDDPQEQFRLETLVQDAARALSPDAVRVGIQEHRKHSQWMPALCDLVQHSKEWRRDRADDAHRQSLAKETAERRALPAPKWTAESEAAWREKFARLLRELQAAPGPESARAAAPPPAKDWSKPPAESDLSAELRAFAMERGLAKVPQAA